MRIEWIEVKNFKGFNKRRFDFDKRFTLFVGENGSGKTTVVAMICQVLGGWADGLASAGWNPNKLRELLRVNTTTLPSGKVSAYVLPLKLDASLLVGGQHVSLAGTIVSEEQPDAFRAEMQAALRTVTARFAADGLQFEQIFPVCAAFPSTRTFAAVRPDWSQIMAAKPFRKDGYENWENEQSPAGRLSEWMGRQEAIAREENAEAPSYGAVKSALAAALPDSRKVWFSARQGEPVVEWNSGQTVGYSILSDGQKSILTIVGDIARRAALLNPHLNDPAAETPGVVVIDEIDLHLHPRWQRRIMEDLRRVFPKIQFIATTHSPVVISAAKGAKVIELDATGSHELGQAYGLDVGWIVDEVMGGESRPAEISKMIHEADELIGEGKLDVARSAVARLKETLNGPDPEVVRLESTIENLESLAHAAD